MKIDREQQTTVHFDLMELEHLILQSANKEIFGSPNLIGDCTGRVEFTMDSDPSVTGCSVTFVFPVETKEAKTEEPP